MTIVPLQHNGASNSIAGGAVDPFEVAFRLAQPTLDALMLVRKPLAWLYRQRRSGRPLFEPSRAAELLELIPDGSRLADAGALILTATEEAAPEAWLHVAIGLMLQADGATIDGDAYRCAVADSLYRDPECWDHYEPDVSAAVVVLATREARLHGAHTPGAFVNLCVKHRRKLRTINKDIDDLLATRFAAEDELEARGLLKLTYDDEGGYSEEWVDPPGTAKPLRWRPAGTSIGDEPVPF